MSGLNGVWKLVGLEHRLKKGGTVYPMGKDPRGLLILTASGFMSVDLSSGNRTKFKQYGLFSGNDEERARAYESYVSYCGKYRVEGKRLFVEAELSLYPNWVGTTQIRFFKLEGDRLSLWTNSFTDNGEEQTAHLEWVKQGDA